MDGRVIGVFQQPLRLTSGGPAVPKPFLQEYHRPESLPDQDMGPKERRQVIPRLPERHDLEPGSEKGPKKPGHPARLPREPLRVARGVQEHPDRVAQVVEKNVSGRAERESGDGSVARAPRDRGRGHEQKGRVAERPRSADEPEVERGLSSGEREPVVEGLVQQIGGKRTESHPPEGKPGGVFRAEARAPAREGPGEQEPDPQVA